MKIIFDVDGVLINGFHANEQFRNRWDENLYDELGITQDDLTNHFFNKRFGDVLIGKRPLHEALNESLGDLKFNGTSQDIIDFWMKNDSNINYAVLDIVKKLNSASCDLYIATNQEHVRANYLWQHLGFKSYFKDIFYSARIGHAKPSLEYFVYINNAIGGEDIIFFDDHPQNIDVAKSCGWQAYLFNEISDLTGNPLIQSLLK